MPEQQPQEIFQAWQETLYALLDSGLADPIQRITSVPTASRTTDALLLQIDNNSWIVANLTNFEALLIEPNEQAKKVLEGAQEQALEYSATPEDVTTGRQISLQTKLTRAIYPKDIIAHYKTIATSSRNPDTIIDAIQKGVPFTTARKQAIAENQLRVARTLTNIFRKPQT